MNIFISILGHQLIYILRPTIYTNICIFTALATILPASHARNISDSGGPPVCRRQMRLQLHSNLWIAPKITVRGHRKIVNRIFHHFFLVILKKTKSLYTSISRIKRQLLTQPSRRSKLLVPSLRTTPTK